MNVTVMVIEMICKISQVALVNNKNIPANIKKLHKTVASIFFHVKICF